MVTRRGGPGGPFETQGKRAPPVQSGAELNCYSGLVITPQAMRGGAPLEAPAETA